MFKRLIASAMAVALAALAAPAALGSVVVTLRGDGVDTNRLTPGQNFDVLVSLSAEPGQAIDSIRRMQFDDRFTAGSAIESFQWEMAGINDDMYFKEIFEPPFPDVVRANYMGIDPIPGRILNLTDQPNLVGRYNLTFSEPGFLDLQGVANEPNVDAGLRFQSGFGRDVVNYNLQIGNVIGGVLPLVPEPATLGLLALGGLALLRRGRRV